MTCSPGHGGDCFGSNAQSAVYLMNQVCTWEIRVGEDRSFMRTTRTKLGMVKGARQSRESNADATIGKRICLKSLIPKKSRRELSINPAVRKEAV